jgi:E-phenylitaconyl-CoA hydratase
MPDASTLDATEKVHYAVEDHLARVTIDRPEKHNAMDPEIYRALSEAWIEIRDDPEVRVALVTGAGEEAFSAGADLEQTITPGERGWDEFWRTQAEPILNNGLEVWKPVVAAVNGYCLAGGLTLLLATDIRIAGEDATFGLSEVKRGILPGNGGTQRTIRQLPDAIAKELLLTGDRIDAQEAARWGLVNEVVPPEDVVSTAEAYAERLVENAPLAMQAIKELAVRGRDLPLDEGIRLEESFQRHLWETDDAVEGVEAFREDREPEWRAQ